MSASPSLSEAATSQATPSDPHAESLDAWLARSQPPAGLRSLREGALARFAELGFPAVTDEDWRFTNVASVARLPFHPVLAPRAVEGLDGFLRQIPFATLNAHRLVFVDGHLDPARSAMGTLPAGVRVDTVGAMLAGEPGGGLAEVGETEGVPEDGFAALNRAFFTDGVVVSVGAGAVLDRPLHVLQVLTGQRPGAVAHPRHSIRVEAGGRATILEQYVSMRGGAHWVNTVTELVAGAGAVVEHIKFQDQHPESFHFGGLHGRFGAGSRVWLHSFALGGRIARNNLRTRLAGEGLEAVLNGLYLTAGERVADHHMVVDHAEPRCASHEYFNGILDDRSRGVFHGRILVRQKAQKTDAKQTNKNLLLSDDAQANSKPQLEIYADDVKCTHGATVGQLDEESVFYLRSRGIGLERARRMLMHAFAGEITDRVQCEAIRTELDRLVWDRLEANPRITESTPEEAR